MPESDAIATSLTFTVLAGIVVGGTSILGGEGAIWRTVLGILFIAMLYNGFTLLRIDPLFQGIALGAIILLAVGFDAWSRLRRTVAAVSRAISKSTTARSAMNTSIHADASSCAGCDW